MPIGSSDIEISSSYRNSGEWVRSESESRLAWLLRIRPQCSVRDSDAKNGPQGDGASTTIAAAPATA